MVIIPGSHQTKILMTKPEHFEQSITELETIVSRLEKGDLHLEDALLQFEKGIHLTPSGAKNRVIIRKYQQIRRGIDP